MDRVHAEQARRDAEAYWHLARNPNGLTNLQLRNLIGCKRTLANRILKRLESEGKAVRVGKRCPVGHDRPYDVYQAVAGKVATSP